MTALNGRPVRNDLVSRWANQQDMWATDNLNTHMKTKLLGKRILKVGALTPNSRKMTTHVPVASPSLKLRTILVPVDFSNCSSKALSYASAFAKDYGARLILLTVVATNYAGSEVDSLGVPFLENQLRTKTEKRLAALAKKTVDTKIPVTTVVKVGQPLREIIEAARSSEADLLLVSTHARSGLPDFCLGSAAEQIVRYAPCPVMVVREEEHDFLAPSQ